MFKNILLSVISTLSAAAIVSAIAVEKRVSMIEERESTVKEYLKEIDEKTSFILCKMGEESQCKKGDN